MSVLADGQVVRPGLCGRRPEGRVGSHGRQLGSAVAHGAPSADRFSSSGALLQVWAGLVDDDAGGFDSTTSSGERATGIHHRGGEFDTASGPCLHSDRRSISPD